MGPVSIAALKPLAPPATPFIKVIGILIALWCAAFAVINIWFESSDYFAQGPHAADAAALSVVNWYVVAVNVLGIAVALLAIRQPRSARTATLVGMTLWAAFATIGIYVVGSLVQIITMLVGIMGDPSKLTLGSVGYVLAFSAAGTGFGILAVSYKRRTSLRTLAVVLGILGAPLMLGSILVFLPALLRMAGLLSS